MVKQKKSMDGGSHDDPKELEPFCWLCVVQVMEG